MITNQIIGGLLTNEQYTRHVIPFIKDEYFERFAERAIIRIVKKYLDKYNKIPSSKIIDVIVDQQQFNQDQVDSIASIVGNLQKCTDDDYQWLVEETEKFCQQQALYNAVRTSINILDGEDKTLDKGALPQLLSDALAVSFDSRVGHDFLDDPEQRYDIYQRVEQRIPFDIEYLNLATKGGIPVKTLSVLMAGTGVGKTAAMCHMAASMMRQGYKVLYITAEMAEERIAERIDANCLDLTIDQVNALTRSEYISKFERFRSNITGGLLIKEYPTASANANHIRFLLNEMKIKKNFRPDIIFIDYINIFNSSRTKNGADSYTIVKSIAEEFRGLAIEYNTRIFTATQVNRAGFGSSDVELTETSESFGLPFTADFYAALMSTPELEQLNQIVFKILKNRWGSLQDYGKFVVGINRAKMKLYNVDAAGQVQISAPAPDDNMTGLNYNSGFLADRMRGN